MLTPTAGELTGKYQAANALLLENRNLQFTYQMTAGFFYVPTAVPTHEDQRPHETLNLITFDIEDSLELSKSLQAKLESLNFKMSEFIEQSFPIESSKPSWTSDCDDAIFDALKNHLDINKENIEVLKRYQHSISQLC
ncbi:hypothetical protein V2K00_11595 [Pseudomonas alliivorans]|nr:hypothetical protein [Pseudomonas alliivorans]MEE5094964.1 hypothetical protein [Pseudomonas alliivorans]